MSILAQKIELFCKKLFVIFMYDFQNIILVVKITEMFVLYEKCPQVINCFENHA